MTARRSMLAILGALAAGGPAAAQTTLPDSLARRVDAVFAKFTPAGPGCAVGVFQNGKISYAKGYGAANIEFGIPITPQTPFIQGSLTKQFTAAAIALLVEQGRVSLDDDVHKYVPELADYGKKITVGQLVHHTSGVRDFWALVDAAGMRPDDGYTVADILALASRQKHLNFDPGAEYNYSNTGYVLLGVIVQRASGKTLRQFAAEQIFTPLHMTNSHFHDDHNQPVPGRAAAYSPSQEATALNGWKINIWNNDIVGQGGLMTTIEDLQKWDENFYTGTVGGKGFLARQLERGVLNNGTQISYAFGLEIGAYRGVPVVEHSGSTGGYRTEIVRFPPLHASVATMCNASNADAVGLAHRAADVVLASQFKEPVPPPPARAAAAQQAAATATLTDAEAMSMAGRYHSVELNADYDLSHVGNRVVLKRPRALADTLRAVDRQTLRATGLTIRFTGPAAFTIDNGRARGIEFVRTSSGSK